jgi:hypothetical protein
MDRRTYSGYHITAFFAGERGKNQVNALNGYLHTNKFIVGKTNAVKSAICRHAVLLSFKLKNIASLLFGQNTNTLTYSVTDGGDGYTVFD